ncbi:hypothetical protein [Pseudomonas phage PA1C]|uniref:Uncharacterized protein n=1 Tax=Pseudomonas phage vB_PaeM_PS119XW TaxID=2601632 RepID=A0A5C1K7G4_9CAUD|nr:hypothetical protein PP933_gp328 [Pseudomonas phage vB_PaeM_PS119XW]QBX32485.1 hypothetical protein [Pseudomonas phage PA1C]QEM42057.1 hypothetical protein [Pseudomonas phage vB_PaeM_PS119XW]BEG72572.1 hypothetical protein RVBP21_2000 [Pseudomonas phage BRkr]
MNSNIKLVKNEGEWLVQKMETQNKFTFSLDDDTSWVSLGIHPDSGLRFECNMSGVLERVYRVKDNIDLDVVEIPSNHGLARQLNIQ